MKVFCKYLEGFVLRQALSQLVYEIRNPETEAEPFRAALESIGEYLALGVQEELATQNVTIKTLMGAEATHALVSEKPVLITILRAGLPLNAGVQRVFPHSEVGFFAMSRNEETLKADVEYQALPELKNAVVILSDSMLATGGSLLDAIKIIEPLGPKQIYVVVAIASEAGLARIRQHNPAIKIHFAALDPLLNDKGYILPGLGDAGDRAFGKKAYVKGS